MPLVCGRTVAIMDQHAAAERVRLEQLQHEVPAFSMLCPSFVHGHGWWSRQLGRLQDS